MRITSNSPGLRRLSQRIVNLASDGVTTNFSRIFELFLMVLAIFVLIGNRKTIISINSFNSLLPRLSVNTHVCYLSLQMPDEPFFLSIKPLANLRFVVKVLKNPCTLLAMK